AGNFYFIYFFPLVGNMASSQLSCEGLICRHDDMMISLWLLTQYRHHRASRLITLASPLTLERIMNYLGTASTNAVFTVSSRSFVVSRDGVFSFSLPPRASESGPPTIR